MKATRTTGSTAQIFEGHLSITKDRQFAEYVIYDGRESTESLHQRQDKRVSRVARGPCTGKAGARWAKCRERGS